MSEYLEKVRQGSARIIARTISAVENDDDAAREVTSALYGHTGKSHIVGITGPPGCGKSTLVNELVKKINDQGKLVAIIAVDPSSPFTGGAILGDRVRMSDIASRDGVFIRSMASRGTLGGLAQATSTAIRILDAAGYEIILVETVGAGQAEVEITSVAHTILVVEAPGAGDEVQSIKAGILEIADIFIVNKADHPASLQTVRTLEMMLQIGHPSISPHHANLSHVGPQLEQDLSASSQWQVPVLQTIATEGKGIDELVDKISEHYSNLVKTSELFEREIKQSKQEIERLLQNQIIARSRNSMLVEDRDRFVTAVARREMDPYTAAEKLFEIVNRCS
jgi:LAO/AO transport system kinase